MLASREILSPHKAASARGALLPSKETGSKKPNRSLLSLSQPDTRGPVESERGNDLSLRVFQAAENYSKTTLKSRGIEKKGCRLPLSTQIRPPKPVFGAKNTLPVPPGQLLGFQSST